MSDSITEKIRAIIAEQAVLDLDDVPEDAVLSDLGIDSLGMVEAIFAIEEEFDISVPYNANEPDRPGFDITSVRSIVMAVESLIAARAA